jgi:crotonobetaine/carnitine-CoA ligase
MASDWSMTTTATGERTSARQGRVDSALILPNLLRTRAQESPDRTFVQDLAGDSMTYAQADAAADAWAAVYRGLGVGAGEIVATLVPNGVRALQVWVGLGRVRAVEAPLNPQFFGDLLVHVLNDCAARVLVIHVDHVGVVVDVVDRLEHLETVVLLGSDDLVPVGGLRVVAPQLDAPVDPQVVDDPQPWDLAAILYTSGTTGRSKGVMVPWGQIVSSALRTCPMDGLGPDDCFYVPGSAHHIAAKSLPSLVAMLGCRIVLRPSFRLSEFWDDVGRFGATTTLMLGSMAQYMVAADGDQAARASTLRQLLMAPVVPSYQQVNALLGTRSASGFNMTELSNPIRWTTWDAVDSTSCGTVDDAFPYYEVRLVDERDHEVADGAVGELVVRAGVPWTTNVGYLNQPEATAAAWRNGWFHTGDTFRREETGHYFYVDRLKDSIRRRGENISSVEVEAAVTTHPSVVEAAAIGIPSPHGDEDVMVVVQVSAPLSAAALRAHVVERIPRYMVPRFVRVVDDFPRTVTMRIRKNVLREQGVTADTDDADAAG